MKKENENSDIASIQLLEEISMATNELVTVLMYAHDIDPIKYYEWKDEQKKRVMEEELKQKALRSASAVAQSINKTMEEIKQ